MNYKYMIFAVTAFLAPSIVSANPFIGLWEGVDPDDGGHQVLSISDNRQGGVNLLLHDTYFTLCNGGRGVSSGSGTPLRRTLLSEDYKTYCYDTQQTKAGARTYKMNAAGNLLKVDRSSSNLAPVIYHRTNTTSP
ncbi:MAG: hypothetical protein EPN89_20370 [Methylovulum sp.]|nr:MAG: hypothetical protein EPN89_20370 [Methylovulum sp.]